METARRLPVLVWALALLASCREGGPADQQRSRPPRDARREPPRSPQNDRYAAIDSLNEELRRTVVHAEQTARRGRVWRPEAELQALSIRFRSVLRKELPEAWDAYQLAVATFLDVSHGLADRPLSREAFDRIVQAYNAIVTANNRARLALPPKHPAVPAEPLDPTSFAHQVDLLRQRTARVLRNYLSAVAAAGRQRRRAARHILVRRARHILDMARRLRCQPSRQCPEARLQALSKAIEETLTATPLRDAVRGLLAKVE